MLMLGFVLDYSRRREVNDDYEIVVVANTVETSKSVAEVPKCQMIRQQVFQREQKIAPELDFDGEDFAESTFHILIYYYEVSRKVPFATVRGRPIDYPKGVKLERMCVLRPYRRQKFGRLLLEAFESHARVSGFRDIWLHAQLGAVEFYKAHGFRLAGGPFLEAGINHYLMTKHIN